MRRSMLKHAAAVDVADVFAIHSRHLFAMGSLLGRGDKVEWNAELLLQREAMMGQATPISAVTGMLPSSRAKPDISMRNGMPVCLVSGNPRSTACCTSEFWRSFLQAVSRLGSRSMRTNDFFSRL